MSASSSSSGLPPSRSAADSSNIMLRMLGPLAAPAAPPQAAALFGGLGLSCRSKISLSEGEGEDVKGLSEDADGLSRRQIKLSRARQGRRNETTYPSVVPRAGAAPAGAGDAAALGRNSSSRMPMPGGARAPEVADAILAQAEEGSTPCADVDTPPGAWSWASCMASAARAASSSWISLRVGAAGTARNGNTLDTEVTQDHADR